MLQKEKLPHQQAWKSLLLSLRFFENFIYQRRDITNGHITVIVYVALYVIIIQNTTPEDVLGPTCIDVGLTSARGYD